MLCLYVFPYLEIIYAGVCISQSSLHDILPISDAMSVQENIIE